MSKPNARRIELKGLRFGRLTAQEAVRKPNVTSLFYQCVCDCGNTKIVGAQNLRIGATQSCGCLQKERTSAAAYLHGASKTHLHNVWLSMIQRCYDENCEAWPAYGGRGIKVYMPWRLEFKKFAEDVGLPPAPLLTIDRINNDGHYEPGNCRWATRMDQANNRRSNRHLEYRGERKTLAQWERAAGLKPGRLWDRLNNGWTVERALAELDLTRKS